MKYGIIGTGAIGGYYGAKLAYAGQEVHFLLRSDYGYVRQHGLQVFDFVYSSARQVKTWPLL
jgi:2-dehydropantoate 2-reductase